MKWMASRLHEFDEDFVVPLRPMLQLQREAARLCQARPLDSSSGTDDDFDELQERADELNDSELSLLVSSLQRVPWIPKSFAALVCLHRIDAQAFLELTDSDLRHYLLVEERSTRERLLSYIRLCRTVLETELREEEERCC